MSPAGPDPCLHHIFERQAAATPDAPAVRDDISALTYWQLDEQASRLATVIRRFGLPPGSRVGLHVRRGIPAVTALLAVLKSGYAYVPLDPDYPRDRVRHMADDAGLALVVADQDSSAVLPGIQSVLVDEPLWPHEQPLPSGEVDMTPDAVAYVIYTSGSTGRPKGVEVAHRNVTALLAGCDQVFDLRADDVWAMFHSHCFDFSVWEVWGAFSHGACLAVVPAETARSPQAMLAFLTGHRVTVLNQVPSVFRYLARAATGVCGDDPRQGPPPEPALRYIVFGGEPVDIEAVRTWRRCFGTGTEFVNMYGITETTVLATHRRLSGADLDPHASAGAADPARAIGVPLPGVEIAVLDEQRRRVARGEVGELYQSGAQVALGYLGRPRQTTERFPHLDLDGEGTARRYYRSGDLVSQNPDGSLRYAGRADSQVKINGFRIETDEIRHALSGEPDIEDVVVIAVPSRVGDLMLVCCYTVRPGQDADADADDVPARLAARGGRVLPAHMVPRRFVRVAALPLGPSGKTDERALADLVR